MPAIERIQEMESHLKEIQSFFEDFDQDLAKFEAIKPQLEALEAYYGGEEWFDDFDAYEAGGMPEDLTYQVLSEDGVYDCLVDKHRIALALLDLARDLLA